MTTETQSIWDWLESPVSEDDELRKVATRYRELGREEEAEAFWIAALRWDWSLGHWFCPEFMGGVWIGDCTDWERLDLYDASDPSRDYLAPPEYRDDPMGELES